MAASPVPAEAAVAAMSCHFLPGHLMPNHLVDTMPAGAAVVALRELETHWISLSLVKQSKDISLDASLYGSIQT